MQLEKSKKTEEIFKNITSIVKNSSYISLLDKHIAQSKINSIDMKRYDRIVRENALNKIKLTKQIEELPSLSEMTAFISTMDEKRRVNMSAFIEQNKIFLSEKEITNLSIQETPVINHGYHVTPELMDVSVLLKNYNENRLTDFIEMISKPLSQEYSKTNGKPLNINDNIRKIREEQDLSTQSKLTL